MSAGRVARAVLAAVLAAGSVPGCAGSDVQARLQTAAVLVAGSPGGHLDPPWIQRQLRAAARDVRAALAAEGVDALVRLRLRGEELDGFYTPEAATRARMMHPGIAPSEGERRWTLFANLAQTDLVGFCARGARVVEPRGPEGLRARAFVVDRLLIVGRERDGLWGAWIEGLVLTAGGWRLLPTIPFSRQVETPRRDHADLELWDCDVAAPPRQGATL